MKISREVLEKEFNCLRCGNCCKWRGYVNVTELEIEKIAEYFSMDFDEYMQKFVVLRHDRRGLSLDENSDGSCIYYDSDRQICLIQQVKPEQCKNFPISWNFDGFEEECAGAKALLK